MKFSIKNPAVCPPIPSSALRLNSSTNWNFPLPSFTYRSFFCPRFPIRTSSSPSSSRSNTSIELVSIDAVPRNPWLNLAPVDVKRPVPSFTSSSFLSLCLPRIISRSPSPSASISANAETSDEFSVSKI